MTHRDTTMLDRFKAPEPIPFERNDLYLSRVVQAFEDWVNEQFPIDHVLSQGE